jgi:hypothetical protein
MRALLLAMAFAAAATPALAEFKLASTDVKSGSPMASTQVFNGFGCTGQHLAGPLLVRRTGGHAELRDHDV